MPSKARSLYPIHQSPLFRLLGKNQFRKIIGVEWDAIPKLLERENYRVWTTEKGREIQAPKGWMAAIHARIAVLLSRIELPDYLYSRKGRSYADNAQQHIGPHPVAKTDISKFYPSTTRAMVVDLFKKDFQCAEDVAHRLADICCYGGKHLPTGSPLSGRMAFFAGKHMFDEVAKLAATSDCTLTVYVDDITLSGPVASKALLSDVRRIVRRHGFKTEQRKSKTFAAGAAKIITGAVATKEGLRLPNDRHRKIWLARKGLQGTESTLDRIRAQRELRGRLQEAKQILERQGQ